MGHVVLHHCSWGFFPVPCRVVKSLQFIWIWRHLTWWRHQMETFSALLALCEGNSPMTGEFPWQRPVTRGFDISLIHAWTNNWVNTRDAGHLRRHRAHYDITVIYLQITCSDSTYRDSTRVVIPAMTTRVTCRILGVNCTCHYDHKSTNYFNIMHEIRISWESQPCCVTIV